MSEKISPNLLLYPDHPRPVTRRQMLSQGLISFSATLLAPTLLGTLWRSATAQAASDCSAAGARKGLMPFLVFDMAGGAALPGNFLVGKQGGAEDFLSSYDTLGWNPRSASALDKRFGLPMAGNNVSKILQGITQTASTAAQANLRMGSFCHFSQDDTRSNSMSALTLVAKAGYTGSVILQGLGSENSGSGGNSDSVLKDVSLKPLSVSSVDDIANSLTFGSAFSDMTEADLQNMQQVAAALSQDQKARLGELSGVDQLAALSQCAHTQNIQYTKSFAGADPRTDSALQKIYNLSRNSNARDKNTVAAGIVMNVLKNQSGPGAITVGGCDYHTGNQTTGDQKDLEMGQEIGRAVEAAFVLKTPLFFQLLTDGGVSATPGTRNWSSDSGVRSMTVIGYYNPAAAPKMRRLQVGHYTDGQAVNQSTLIGAEPSKVGYAVFANYLNACGLAGDFATVAGRSALGTDQLDEVLIFE